MGLLISAFLAIALALSSSVRVIKASRGQLVAHRAAEAVVESMRATPYATVYDRFWSDPTLTTAILGTPPRPFVTGGDADGILATVQDKILSAAVQSGAIHPSAHPALALRFVGEAEYVQIWGSSLDINLNGTPAETLPQPATASPNPAYAFHPVIVQVRWRDDGGEQVFTLSAVLTHEAPIDPERK